MRSVQQGSERSQTQEKHCVEVKFHATLVLLSAHTDSSTVEYVGKLLAIYQFGGPDVFVPYIFTRTSIDNDGIFLTHGFHGNIFGNLQL